MHSFNAAAAEVAEALGIGKLADAGRATSVQAITAKTGEGVKPAVQVSRLMLASSDVLLSQPVAAGLWLSGMG